MRQVIQDGRSGAVTVMEVPAPTVSPGRVLVRTAASVVSAGTERDMLAFAQKSLLDKARERPDLVRQVVDKARREGIAEAYRAAASRLDSPTPLGYSSAGVVIAVGGGVEGIVPGDHVACAGAGYAVHAEVVAVPKNLCARIPDSAGGEKIPLDEAAFTTLGAVALQGVRLAEPTLGERVVVIGLGVIGQLACQLLRVHGCAVFALDTDPGRVALAQELGAEGASVVSGAEREAIDGFTRGRGADAVVIAAATSSNSPIVLAGEVSRRKGRVVVIGNVGMNVPRRPYYERELTLVVSSSYGPGRYDRDYEERGNDYPLPYVRWTAQRNMEAVLDAMMHRRLRVAPLVSHRFTIERAAEAFELIRGGAEAPSLGIVLSFPSAVESTAAPRTLVAVRDALEAPATAIGVGAVGAGAFARSVVFPRLRNLAGVRLRTVATSSGTSAASAARKYGFELAATTLGDVLADRDLSAVFVLTRHGAHGEHVLAALRAGKHVFVEKPLCVTADELHEIAKEYSSLVAAGREPVLTVGFNRRFSPLTARVKEAVKGNGALLLDYRVNAGRVPSGHWLSDPAEGGRVVGEACHFIDLASSLTGGRPRRVFATGGALSREPTTIVVELSDGSVLDLNYVQDGPRAMPKERLEIFQGPNSWIIEDWHAVTKFADHGERRTTVRGQQKGHDQEIAAFLEAARTGGPPPIPIASLLATTMATFCALESMRTGLPVEVPEV